MKKKTQKKDGYNGYWITGIPLVKPGPLFMQVRRQTHVKEYELREKALTAVHAERERQIEKWGLQRHTWGKWLGILAEEFGEIGQAINRIHFPRDAKLTDSDNLGEELIQTAAVALAMYEQWLEEK
jgi:NTP pyrophosphatase (non-canonical NTP hydrolase)